MNSQLNLMANETDLAARALMESTNFTPIYDHYFPKVYNYVRYRVGDRDVADDLTSLIFERIFTRIDTYQPDRAPLSAWIFAVARHAIDDHFRLQKRRRWFSLDLFVDQPSPAPMPEEVAARSDTCQQLLDAIRRLNPREQDLISLKFSSGLENVEIARITGLTESNVGVILYRALRHLRTLLVQEGESV